MENLFIRQATENDIPFLVEAFMVSQSTLPKEILYHHLYEISESALQKVLAEMMSEDIEGQYLNYSGCLLAELNGETVGSVNTWIEAYQNQPSLVIETQLLAFYLGKDKVEKASHNIRPYRELLIPRKIHHIQIELVYVKESARGKGIAQKLIVAQVEKCLRIFPEVQKIQIQLSNQNSSAQKVYQKLGFEIAQKSLIQNAKAIDFPENLGLISMETNVQNLLGRFN